MKESNLRNMVVLKDLPSNLVEEAIVILKSSKDAKKLEKVNKNKSIDNIEKRRIDKEYILKEAEMLISNYILKIEDNNKNKYKIQENKNYKRLKNYAYLSTALILIETIIIIL